MEREIEADQVRWCIGETWCKRIWQNTRQTILAHHDSSQYLTIIELTMWPCVWPCVLQPTPKTADVTITKIAGYVRILMNR